jgi:hypothetical protein
MSNSALLACLILACSGCPQTGQGGGDCEYNQECAPDVCGRDHICTEASNVREVTVSWTVRGQVASEQTCGNSQTFTLTFFADELGGSFDDELGFDPVPCPSGQFFIDRLPKRYDNVQLGYSGRGIPIKSDGTVSGDFIP